MNNDFKSFLEQILTIIEYQSDKEIFIGEFMNLCVHQSLTHYMELLSEDRKKQLEQSLQEKDPEKLQALVEPYITTEEYRTLFEENTQKLLLDYLKTVVPTLSQEQQEKLDNFFVSLKGGSSMTTSPIGS